MTPDIPFNKPYMGAASLRHIEEAHRNGHLSGDGPFAKKCQAWIEEKTGCAKALLTPSGTASLEMAAMLAGIGPGDEVIMPSFTFVSTANAFVLRGGVPVFVDIRPDTLNMDEHLVEEAVTEKTRAIVPVHYAGVSCEMGSIMETAEKHGLTVIEDAAQGILADYKGAPLGSIGHMGALSFHETKTLHCGEGGALVINDAKLIERAEILREKGTDRASFFRGAIDKYTWRDIGSSYLPSELAAAFLWGQFEEAGSLVGRRMAMWRRYHDAFREAEEQGKVRRPVVPGAAGHSAHLYYLLLNGGAERAAFIDHMKRKGIAAVFHYVPLHDSPAGRRFARAGTGLRRTDETAARIVRMPLWIGMEPEQDRVIDCALEALAGLGELERA